MGSVAKASISIEPRGSASNQPAAASAGCRASDIWHLWATEHSSITAAFIFHSQTTTAIDWLSSALELSDKQRFF